MDREEFINIVYDELYNDSDNNRANRIINAADEYAESMQYNINIKTKEDCISRQAAIDAIKDRYYKYGRFAKIEELEYTIERLPPTQPEPCEDAVSRKAAIRACGGYMVPVGIIKALPPVTPKQRTGYWYPVGMAEAVGGESAQWGSAIAYHKCSECDEQALKDNFEQEVLSEWCPHCGVKMVGVSE